MKPRVLLVRHGDEPNDDRVVSYLETHGFRPDIRKPFAGDALGAVTDDLAGTVIYGGMYNACDADRQPFLHEEYRWIGAALDAGVPVLGLCQGAQMIAYHQGAFAGQREGGRHEFGYYQIRPTAQGRDFLPHPLHMAQAHFHTFDLPAGAVHLAESDAYENQAFRLGDKVYGLQFHPEQTIEGFRRWQRSKTAAYGKPGAQTRQQQDALMMAHDTAQADWFNGFLGRLFGRA